MGLVFGGCGSAIIATGFPEVGIGLPGVSLAFGLTVLAIIYSLGHISGAHLIQMSLLPYGLEVDLAPKNPCNNCFRNCNDL